jgi:hypothetical protein
MRTVVRTLMAFSFVAVTAGAVRAQDGFQIGYMDIGPTVGLGGIGSASAAIGGRLERGFKQVPDLGNGILGFQVSFDYYSWSNSFFNYKYIPIGATVNYHFQMVNKKIDPFLGLGLGYQIITCSYSGIGSDLCDNSAIYFIGRAGARYFFSPKMALYGDLGAGAATINIGLMFKMR